MRPLSRQIPRLYPLVSIALVLGATACAAAPSAPETVDLRPRREMGCVGSTGNGQPVDTVPPLPDGNCQPGFDSISWW